MSSSVKSVLFSPLTIRGVTFKNRIGVSPMCQYSCTDGFTTDWHFAHLGSFAIGGAALVMVEMTGVTPEGRITPGCTGIWKDEHIAPFERITKFIKSQGAVPGIQLAHAGRKGSTVIPWTGRNQMDIKDGGWETIGPSPIAFGDSLTRPPKEATLQDIEELKNAFVLAAKRSLRAGFQVIELQYAHGYLISTFLSPHCNKRTDKYGGSLENRMRFGLEIAEKVRKVLPEDIVLGVRISVTDYAENGWDVTQSVEFAKQLKKIGVDFVDCSSGGIVSNVDYNPLGTNEIQVKAAAIIQQEVGVPTGAVGQIVSPHFAEKILKQNGASFVFLGRALLNNPHWPYLAADALAQPNTFKYPPQYEWCIGWMAMGKWRNKVFKDQNNN